MSIAGNSLEFYPRANEIERWVWRGSNGRSFTGYNPRALAEFLVKISTVA
jgi:hypothetical protein